MPLRAAGPTGLLQPLNLPPSFLIFKKNFVTKIKFQQLLYSVNSNTSTLAPQHSSTRRLQVPALSPLFSLNTSYPFLFFSCFFKTLTQHKYSPPTNSNPSNLQNSLHLILNFFHSLRPLFKFPILIHLGTTRVLKVRTTNLSS